MLCQFTFSNFKSYRDEVTLDLCPANISEHSETLIVDKTDETNYLPIAAIYGPNGGGKSNVIEAFHFLRRTVLIPPQLDKTVLPLDGGSIDQSRAAQKKYFLFDDSGKTLPSSFEVIFRKSGREYKYILKIKEGLIVEENLYATDTDTQEVMLVFERMKDRIELSELLSGANVDKVNPTMPLIQYLTAMYDFDIIKNAVSWFIVAKTINYGNSHSEKSVIFPDTPREKKYFFDVLHEIDVNIKGIRLDKNEDGDIVNASTEYLIAGERYFLDFSQESSGTQKLLSFLLHPLIALEKGSVLFADELDAKLHPKMIEYIIKLFTDPIINKRGAQLVITSHDLYTMNNTLFRRDEIWFAAKGDDLSSRLYSLSEFKKGTKKARKDESYGKQYIEGRYGADPYLKKIVDWEA